jgi:very-short-patch-repair endonuclease
MYGEKKALELKEKSSIFRKGKTYEEIFGEEKGKKYKEELSRARMGRVISEETKYKISKTQLGVHKRRIMSKEMLHEIRINSGMKGKVGWNKEDTKYTNSSVMKIAIATQANWDILTPDEKYHKLAKMYKQPNKEEKYILDIVQFYGFRFCGDKTMRIGNHNPDFVHKTFPIIIEYDGEGGHNPELPWVPKNQQNLDKKRNLDYIKEKFQLIVINKKTLSKVDIIVSRVIARYG